MLVQSFAFLSHWNGVSKSHVQTNTTLVSDLVYRRMLSPSLWTCTRSPSNLVSITKSWPPISFVTFSGGWRLASIGLIGLNKEIVCNVKRVFMLNMYFGKMKKILPLVRFLRLDPLGPRKPFASCWSRWNNRQHLDEGNWELSFRTCLFSALSFKESKQDNYYIA